MLLKWSELLSKPWFAAASILFAIMFIQTIGGKFEDKNIEAWGWLTQNILPGVLPDIKVLQKCILKI